MRAPWLDGYITELIGFPGVKHDDQVDSTTQALDYLREPDIAAEYNKAFSSENVLRFLGRNRHCS